jgi:hypothetical protein
MLIGISTAAGFVGQFRCGSRAAATTTTAGTYTCRLPITVTDGTTNNSTSFSVTVK